VRVGIYAPDLRPEDGGGYTYQRDIVDALAAIRPETTHKFVVIGRAYDAPSGWDASNYLSLDLDAARRAEGDKRVVRRLRRKLKAATGRTPTASRWPSDELFDQQALDLVWCVSAGAPTRELPYVTTVLDLQHRRQPMFPEVSAHGEWDERERFFSRELRAATMVIVGNATGQAEVEAFYGVLPERIRQLPHPTPAFALDDQLTDTDVVTRHRLDRGYVLYPAQFWAHKNHVGLLKAMAILRDKHGVALDAVFVGADKGNQAHVESVARSLNLQDQVKILGFVRRDDLVTLYRKAFALAYVTYFGPENLPPLEAFALGCPVVASDVPGAREQLGDAALFSPPSDADALAAALFALNADAELRQGFIARGLERARAQTPSTYATGLLGVLDELEPMVRTWR
jgi:glycosyltransferase involved in cell wall biosynthesis